MGTVGICFFILLACPLVQFGDKLHPPHRLIPAWFENVPTGLMLLHAEKGGSRKKSIETRLYERRSVEFVHWNEYFLCFQASKLFLSKFCWTHKFTKIEWQISFYYDLFYFIHEFLRYVFSGYPFEQRLLHKCYIWMVSFLHELIQCAYSFCFFEKKLHHKYYIWIQILG